ncbi:hypothetical protein ACHQM5_005138 [Ranunculus cassubicifolius]
MPPPGLLLHPLSLSSIIRPSNSTKNITVTLLPARLLPLHLHFRNKRKWKSLKGIQANRYIHGGFGSESEESAVFVDEVKCVGCLKCALLAEKTFAIESVYGRARVVAQWADPEDKILDAMEACPVDCISMVERSNLATLEFLMSKQPRGKVGAPVGKGMVDVKKFQSKLQQAKNKESIQDPRETAFHTIRSISNWFYWQSPMEGEKGGSLIHIAGKSSPFNAEKLREAAAAAKPRFKKSILGVMPNSQKTVFIDAERYIGLSRHYSRTFLTAIYIEISTDIEILKDIDQFAIWTFPLVLATFASTIVRLQVQEGSNVGVEQHMVAGPLPLEIAILAGCTWYLVAFVSVGYVRALINRPKM